MNTRLVCQDSGEKTYITPRRIMDALGHFDTDPCTPPNMPWKTADAMYTEEDDGRTAEWRGRVWLNPPYGKDAFPFLERMAHHDGGGIALVFVRTDARQWHEWIFPFADSVLFVRGRIRFCDTNGVPSKSSAPTPSALVAYSRHDTDVLKESGIKGTLIMLNNTKGNAQ